MKHNRRKLHPFIRKYHALGWSDAEIAFEYAQANDTRCDRHAISEARKAMGLGSNRFSEHCRRRVAETTKYQLKAEDADSLGEIRGRAFALKVASSGWPLDLSLRESEILTALEKHPQGLTRPQICEAIGLPWRGTRRSLKGRREGSHLAYLLSRFLVVYEVAKTPADAPKFQRADGVWTRPPRTHGVYRLAPGVKRRAVGNPWSLDRFAPATDEAGAA